MRTSAGVVVQVERDAPEQANRARLVRGVAVVGIGDTSSRRIGELHVASTTADLVDAHVALLSTPGDRVVTSDRGGLDALLRRRQASTLLVEV